MARQRLTRNRRSNNQIETLVCYMEQHSLFARGQIPKLGAQGHVKFKNMWNELADLLNGIGPSQKTVEAWQKCWTKLRLTAKANKARYMKALMKTGHDAPDTEISQIDERISQIYGRYGTGINIGRELGFRKRTQFISHETPDYSDELSFCNRISLVTVSSERLFASIPLRMDAIFAEFTSSLMSLHESNADRKKTAQKPNDEQLLILVDFMERHQDLANNVDINAKVNWDVLITLLHSVKDREGNPVGARKTVKGWQRTWNGLVTSARQNMKFMLDGSKDGPMLPHHVRIIDVVDYREVYGTPNLSIHGRTTMQQPPQSTRYNLPSTSQCDFRGQSPMPMLQPPQSGMYNMTSTSRSDFRHQGTMQQPQVSHSSMYNLATTSRNDYRSQAMAFPLPGHQLNQQYNQPSTSTYNHNNHQIPNHSVLNTGEPARKFMRYENPGASSTITSTSNSSNGTSVTGRPSASTSSAGPSVGGDKSSVFLKAFEEKGVQMISTLANQLIGCFEKQNQALSTGLNALGTSILETLPMMIGQEFDKALKKAQLIPERVAEETTNEAQEIVEQAVVEPCAICQDALVEPKALKCRHTFCKICIDTWSEHSKECPMCRVPIDPEDMPNDTPGEEWSWATLAPSDSDDEE